MKKAQSTLELTLSLVIILILLGGMIGIVSWSVRSMVKRHNAYLRDFKDKFNKPGDLKPILPDADLVPKVER